jgi:glycosyltransferase involved in cell wall biosynthesis
MSYGVPVITSNNSSLPEAAGESVILVDSNSISELATAIVAVCCDSSLRQSLTIRGKYQATQFNWSDCAKSMLNVYQEVALEQTLGNKPC